MTAKIMKELLEGSQIISQPKEHVQDPYSFRCIPQVHGASKDAIDYVKKVFKTEKVVSYKDVTKYHKVKKGDVLADTSTSDNGEMALGQNILIAFMSWGGNNYEDAIILSQRLVKDGKFSSIKIDEFVVNVRDTKLGPEVTTHDIPNVGEAKLKDLDEEGIVRIGAGAPAPGTAR